MLMMTLMNRVRARSRISDLEDERSTVISDRDAMNNQIDSLETQVEYLTDEVASRFTYTPAGIITVLTAIIFGVIGYFVAKRK